VDVSVGEQVRRDQVLAHVTADLPAADGAHEASAPPPDTRGAS
jgi:hypothetical protein